WRGTGGRHARSCEALDLVQGLLSGELKNYSGAWFDPDDAQLYDRPEVKPAVVVAAGGPQAARLAGQKGYALIVTDPGPELIEAYCSASGEGPRSVEVALCYAESAAAARKKAHRDFRWS